jgi:hypothetical protein
MGEKEGDRDVVIEDNFEDRVKEEVGGKKVVDVKVDEAAADGFWVWFGVDEDAAAVWLDVIFVETVDDEIEVDVRLKVPFPGWIAVDIAVLEGPALPVPCNDEGAAPTIVEALIQTPTAIELKLVTAVIAIVVNPLPIPIVPFPIVPFPTTGFIIVEVIIACPEYWPHTPPSPPRNDRSATLKVALPPSLNPDKHPFAALSNPIPVPDPTVRVEEQRQLAWFEPERVRKPGVWFTQPRIMFCTMLQHCWFSICVSVIVGGGWVMMAGGGTYAESVEVEGP